MIIILVFLHAAVFSFQLIVIEWLVVPYDDKK